MRILFCSEQPPLPPLDDGIRLPLHSLIANLEGRHDVRIVALHDPDRRPGDAPARALRLVPRPSASRLGDAARIVRAEVTGRPLRADSLASRLRPAVREEVKAFDPDVVHVTTGQIAGVLTAVDGRPAVLAAHDAWYRNVDALAREARGVRRLVYQREVARVRRFERTEYAGYRAVVVVTEEDAAALAELGDLPLHVIANGVDSDFFGPDPQSEKTPLSVAFHGGLYHAPNVTAAHLLAERILPAVRDEIPHASLTIVGRDPLPSVRRLHRPDDGVRVVADVEDVRPFLREAAVYAVPMASGTGIKNKLLEALACGLACVATTRAVQGLDVIDGRHVVLADDWEQFAARLVDLLRDPEQAHRLGVEGRRYVVDAHDWSAVARRYERLYEAVAAMSAPRRGA